MTFLQTVWVSSAKRDVPGDGLLALLVEGGAQLPGSFDPEQVLEELRLLKACRAGKSPGLDADFAVIEYVHDDLFHGQSPPMAPKGAGAVAERFCGRETDGRMSGRKRQADALLGPDLGGAHVSAFCFAQDAFHGVGLFEPGAVFTHRVSKPGIPVVQKQVVFPVSLDHADFILGLGDRDCVVAFSQIGLGQAFRDGMFVWGDQPAVPSVRLLVLPERESKPDAGLLQV